MATSSPGNHRHGYCWPTFARDLTSGHFPVEASTVTSVQNSLAQKRAAETVAGAWPSGAAQPLRPGVMDVTPCTFGAKMSEKLGEKLDANVSDAQDVREGSL